MSAEHRAAGYSLLVAVRKRRRKRLEQYLRVCEAELAAAQGRADKAGEDVAHRRHVHHDYAEQLARRTALRSLVRVDELHGARAHHEYLGRRLEDALDLLTQSEQAVRSAEQLCEDGRLRVARNEEQIRSLDKERERECSALAAAAERRTDDEVTEVAAYRIFSGTG